ncbi:hypothetical protein MLD52_22845 [Puniceicoccaceae bacterium K14]|nr:hypothetical protein [Puniceicoccaceae bacterium K14]
MNCSHCQIHERRLWTFQARLGFEEVEKGNWIFLKRCPQCDQLWCEVPHEPFASFSFWAAWPYSIKEWKRLSETEEALILHEWHTNVIREEFDSLPEKEKADIESWRDRTYREFNVIDRDPDFKYCNSSSDLEKHIENLCEQGS